MNRWHVLILSPRVLSIRVDASCRAALELFLEHHIASLPVVNADGQVVGIMSETDMMTPASLFQRVSDVFTRHVVTVRADAPISQGIRLFQSRRLRYLPVVDAHDRLLGIVGRRDVLAYYARTLANGSA